MRSGAALVLVDEKVGKDPGRLAEFIAERRLTVWYSTPSILGLLAQYGDLERRNLDALRLVLFAGEVFPIKHLRSLQRLIPQARYFNLYGPTETNVCTYHEMVERLPEERTEDLPIGRACAHVRTRVVDETGREVGPGQEGELWVDGEPVMQGYWNLPDRTDRAFESDADGRWYKTGDIVILDENGDYVFRGRRDRMIKKRGYRIELGEIESCLSRHDGVEEVGVVATADAERGVVVTAFVGAAGEGRPSIVGLKAFCAQHLPLYMVPDFFVISERLPRTSTGKVNYQELEQTS